MSFHQLDEDTSSSASSTESDTVLSDIPRISASSRRFPFSYVFQVSHIRPTYNTFYPHPIAFLGIAITRTPHTSPNRLSIPTRVTGSRFVNSSLFCLIPKSIYEIDIIVMDGCAHTSFIQSADSAIRCNMCGHVAGIVAYKCSNCPLAVCGQCKSVVS